NLCRFCLVAVFFVSSRRRHTRFSRDWSSDVCSSDLSDLVEYFEVLGHHFINVREDSGWSGLRPGYYDLLYDGDMKLLCKRKKSINEKIENGVVDVSFIERATYHLLRDGEAISVRKKASILKALDDKKKALKQFARANGLGNRNKEEMLISLIRHYESLD